MRITKYVMALFAAAMLCFPSFSQEKKITFGLMGGYGYTMPKLKDSRTIKNPSINGNSLNGFHFGPVVTFNFNQNSAFQTGLIYNFFTGTSIDKSQLALKKSLGNWYQYKTTLSAFDLPLRYVYSFPLAENLSVFVFAGPNLNYALYKSTPKQIYVNNKLDVEENKENIYTTSNYNRFDIQIGGGGGIQWQGVFVKANYDWGLLNRSNIVNASLHANDFKVSLGYNF